METDTCHVTEDKQPHTCIQPTKPYSRSALHAVCRAQDGADSLYPHYLTSAVATFLPKPELGPGWDLQARTAAAATPGTRLRCRNNSLGSVSPHYNLISSPDMTTSSSNLPDIRVSRYQQFHTASNMAHQGMIIFEADNADFKVSLYYAERALFGHPSTNA